MARPAAAVERVIKAYDVRGLVGSEIDEAFVAEVGAAFARLIREEGVSSRVVIGHDMRASSPELAAAFAAGVTGQGLDVVQIGLASTDQLYFASGLLDCPGAMFTASHNPAAYNGIKLCRAAPSRSVRTPGWPRSAPRSSTGCRPSTVRTGRLRTKMSLADYGKFLRSLVNLADVRPRFGLPSTRATEWPPHHARGSGCGFGADGAAAVLRARRHVPEP